MVASSLHQLLTPASHRLVAQVEQIQKLS